MFRCLKGPTPFKKGRLTQGSSMGPILRILCGLSPAFLVALLVVTTPLGTGDSVHQIDLLHPLLPHVHVINGRVVTHSGGATDSPVQQAGPAIGGGAGADAASAGLGLSPTVPALAEAAVLPERLKRLSLDLLIPTGRVEAPPDPPPTSLA
jgi:hypothetical protein